MSENRKEKNKIKKHSGSASRFLMVGIGFILLLTAVSTFYLRFQTNGAMKLEQEYAQYDKHYVMITNDDSEYFWQSVYEGACEEGEKTNTYIERLGKNLTVSYTKAELLEIAIQAQVDGIIIEADESNEMVELINKAIRAGIPVVTVLNDCTNSERQSYVGVNNYTLGQKYAQQVIDASTEDTKNIMILIDADAEDSSQNIIYSGIRDAIEKTSTKEVPLVVETVSVNTKSTFSAEESIRDIFLNKEELPDIIICLDALNTTCAYQAAVDYNKVGEISIIGYYESETILKAIEHSIIFSTVTIDTTQMGAYCVESLNEYLNTGYVSDYITVDIKAINNSNVEEYLTNDTETVE